MGTIANLAWKCIKWVGKCITKVVKWWISYEEKTNQITYNFLIIHQDEIESADDPQTVGEITVINKEKEQLEETARQKYLSLSYDDRKRVDELLANKNY